MAEENSQEQPPASSRLRRLRSAGPAYTGKAVQLKAENPAHRPWSRSRRDARMTLASLTAKIRSLSRPVISHRRSGRRRTNPHARWERPAELSSVHSPPAGRRCRRPYGRGTCAGSRYRRRSEPAPPVIGGRGMGVVAPPLAVKVAAAVAAGGVGGSSAPSLGRKLFIDAHASISVPSTEK